MDTGGLTSEHRFGIDDLLTRYATAIDGLDWVMLDTVFTSDAHLDYRSAGGLVGTYPEVRQWLADVLPIFEVTQHLVVNRELGQDDDGFRARSCFLNVNRLTVQGEPWQFTVGVVTTTVWLTPRMGGGSHGGSNTPCGGTIRCPDFRPSRTRFRRATDLSGEAPGARDAAAVRRRGAKSGGQEGRIGRTGFPRISPLPTAGAPPDDHRSQEDNGEGHDEDGKGRRAPVVGRRLALLDESRPLGAGRLVGCRWFGACSDRDRVEQGDDGGLRPLSGTTGAARGR